MTHLEELKERRRRKTTMRLPQLNKANRLARRYQQTVRRAPQIKFVEAA